MTFYSPDFDDFHEIPDTFTCSGEGISPTFIVGDVPAHVKELVLICHDPDATRGSDFTHWIVTGISPSVTEISSASLPSGAKQHTNDFGAAEYGGPCPPPGSASHRYIFSLFAVDKKVSNDASSRELVLKDITGHISALATWTGTYRRPA